MSVSFTEEMKGFYAPGAPAYDTGYVTGQRDWNRLMFHLTITADDVRAMTKDPRHRMRAEGFVRCRELGAADLLVQGGSFDLFAPSPTPGRLQMGYCLPVQTNGGPMTLLGFKDVGNDGGIDVWADTTTLFTRLVPGTGDPDRLLEHRDDEHARGILRLDAPMFARQLTTVRGPAAEVARFGAFFTARLLAVYGRRPTTEVVP